MNKERLLKLADFLEKLPPERFDYNRWVGADWKGMSDLSCGTTACAAGWATTIPEFREAGLCLEHDFRGVPVIRFGKFDPYDQYSSLKAAALFFEVAKMEARFLFSPEFEGDRYCSPGADAGPKEVAKHIRRFVRFDGIYTFEDMDSAVINGDADGGH